MEDSGLKQMLLTMPSALFYHSFTMTNGTQLLGFGMGIPQVGFLDTVPAPVNTVPTLGTGTNRTINHVGIV